MRRPGLWMALGLLLLAGSAWARVGGGESYGGGGGGSGGGDGGGEVIVEIVYWLLYLTIKVPAVGIPLDIVAIGGAIYFYRNNKADRSSASAHALGQATRTRSAVAEGIAKLRQTDPYFSIHPFLDFVGLLFVRYQQARGKNRFEPLAAHLGPDLLKAARATPGQALPRLVEVENVIVGAARVISFSEAEAGDVAIVMEIEANFTEVRKAQDGKPDRQDLYVLERWAFVKNPATPSKPPETISSLRCPSCGASGELTLEGRCGHCSQVVNNGKFHWVVRGINPMQKRKKTSLEVTKGGGVEVGTEVPTVYTPDLQAQRHALEAEDPEFAWPAFEAKARECFLALQAAWTEMKWDRARAFETDHLFETHRFWIERYREAKLNNRVEDVRIERVTPVKVDRDAYFEAITVRIWARALDYTVDSAGNVVAGSKSRPRRFSEYWTFIRRLSTARRPTAAPKDPEAAFCCPSCGAPVTLTQTAICEYCGAKVASGEFGWVVSLIEQDEAYAG